MLKLAIGTDLGRSNRMALTSIRGGGSRKHLGEIRHCQSDRLIAFTLGLCFGGEHS